MNSYCSDLYVFGVDLTGLVRERREDRHTDRHMCKKSGIKLALCQLLVVITKYLFLQLKCSKDNYMAAN